MPEFMLGCPAVDRGCSWHPAGGGQEAVTLRSAEHTPHNTEKDPAPDVNSAAGEKPQEAPRL